MIEAGAPSTEEVALLSGMCARPTGGSHTRTAQGSAQRPKEAKRTVAPYGGYQRDQQQYKGRSPKAQ